jgi:hypothetical protein
MGGQVEQLTMGVEKPTDCRHQLIVGSTELGQQLLGPFLVPDLGWWQQVVDLPKVASTPPGNRQTIAFTWAARILKEAGYGRDAWDALEQALRSAGGNDHDVRTALRERPGRERVHS